MAVYTEQLDNTTPMQQEVLDKHFLRKHGKMPIMGKAEVAWFVMVKDCKERL